MDLVEEVRRLHQEPAFTFTSCLSVGAWESLMSVITAEAEPGSGQNAAGRAKARFWDREAPLAYLFMIPGLLILLLFMGYPFFLGIYLSLTDKMVGFADFSFIGLENYQLLLDDPVFHRTVVNTLIYSFVTVPFKLVLGLGLALVLLLVLGVSGAITALGDTLFPVADDGRSGLGKRAVGNRKERDCRGSERCDQEEPVMMIYCLQEQYRPGDDECQARSERSAREVDESAAANRRTKGRDPAVPP